MKSVCLIILCCGVAITSGASAGIREGFVAGADQVEIHYLQDGPQGAARTILLIPGWRVGSTIWSAQLRYFAARRERVIAIDSRSQGGSSIEYSHNRPEDRANDIHEIIGRLHLSHLSLVGWSQGVQDVSAYVSRFGTGGVDDLVLVDAPVSGGPTDAVEAPRFLTTILQGISAYSRHPREYSAGMMRAIISVPTAPSTRQGLLEASMKTPVDVGISMLIQDLFTVDRRPALRKFNRPTLVIASSRSPFLEAQRRMAASLPMGRFVVIHHAAHAVFFDRPAEFDRDLEAFIADGEASHGMRP